MTDHGNTQEKRPPITTKTEFGRALSRPNSGRPLSSKPAAIRQRKSRRRRRVGLGLFKLYLPVARLEKVVRARSGLASDAPVSRREIRKNLAAGIEWWMTPWLNLNKQRHE